MSWVSDCWGSVTIMDVLVYKHFGDWQVGKSI